jgi:hypothetical protein
MRSVPKKSSAEFESSPVLYIHPDRAPEWLPDMPPHLTGLLSSCERLQPKLSLKIAQHYELGPCPALAGGIDLTISLLDYESLKQIVEIAGATWHGRTLRRAIGKDAFAMMVSIMSEHAFRTGVAQADLAPAGNEEPAEVLLPSRDVMLLDGRLCFSGWLSTLPNPIGKRIALKFPSDFETHMMSPDHLAYGPAIIRKTGEAFVSHA